MKLDSTERPRKLIKAISMLRDHNTLKNHTIIKKVKFYYHNFNLEGEGGQSDSPSKFARGGAKIERQHEGE